MAKLKMPTVSVAFEQVGISALERSQRGIVLLILEEADKSLTQDYLTIYTDDDIPTDITEENQEQIRLALTGYQTTPRKVLVYFIAPGNTKTVTTTVIDGDDPVDDEIDDFDIDDNLDSGSTVSSSTTTTPTTTTVREEVALTPAEKYATALKTIETVKFTYLAIPQIKAEYVDFVATWIKGMRTNKDIMVKAVLPNCTTDSEGIVNFTNSIIRTTEKSYTVAQYCSSVAGILCGTPMTISATYAPVPELIEVEACTYDEMDNRVGNGEFFFFNDGDQIKVARSVNSFVTTYQGKGDDFKFCKIVDLLDMIHDDVKSTAHSNYIGRLSNSSSNRAILIAAINGYFKEFEGDGLLEVNQNRAYIDIEAVKNWRLQNGLNTRDELEGMSDDEIKELNLHENVFLGADLSPLNAIENIKIRCQIQ